MSSQQVLVALWVARDTTVLLPLYGKIMLEVLEMALKTNGP
jgi:hypothetical protein